MTLNDQLLQCENECRRLQDQISALQANGERMGSRLEEHRREAATSARELKKLIGIIEDVNKEKQEYIELVEECDAVKSAVESENILLDSERRKLEKEVAESLREDAICREKIEELKAELNSLKSSKGKAAERYSKS